MKQSLPSLRARLRHAGVILAVAVGLSITAVPAHAADTGTLSVGTAPATAAGEVDYTVYLPAGYDTDTERRYPTLYLLHGRGDTQAAWQQVAGDLDEMIDEGQIQPMVVVMPDAPWNDRGNWYTDSLYTGDASTGAGVAVETALAADLVAHVDATYRTAADREARAVGGYSMGGAGALRFALAHQDTFSAAIVLSPATYVPQPPPDSSVRDYGAFGVENELFDADRYTALSYPASLETFDPALPVHLFIAVGDDEWANPDPAQADHDLDFEAARLYNTVRRAPGITAELRVLDGGHDWDVWQPAFREAIVDVSQRLRTAPAEGWDAELFGSTGDDRAGGIVETADGGHAMVLNLGADWDGYATAGNMDALVVRRDPAGHEVWRHALASAGNDRAYGVVTGADGTLLVAGYTRGDLESGAANEQDDGFVAAIGTGGTRAWTTQVGDPAAADRFYALAADGAGGAYLAGYTSGSFAGEASAGDKDAVLVRVGPAGDVLWSVQLGGSGEDKALAVTPVDSGVVVAGVTGAGMPGTEHSGAGDGWVAQYDEDGAQTWIRAVASPENDMVSGLLTLADQTVLAVGHSRGTIGAHHLGDNDIVVQALDQDGQVLWTTQTGTTTDDRGVSAVAGPGGGATILATTYGAIGEPHGGVDVAAIPLDAAGTPGAALQLGSVERDGADEWDEANLFAAPGSAGAWLTGLTFGGVDGQANAGAGDVFVTTLPVTSDPGPSGEPTDGATDGTGGTPTSGDPGTGGGAGSDAAGPEPGGDLATTGAGPIMIGVLALALLGTGLALVRRRLLLRGA
ncbi:esterase family protein [Ruania alkalisoli]|uniref:Esterase family protein n=1 Tax=Ruania alkalisoli TaxID=2779775 RepID=A0A7M1SUZ0_9MICO|nr:alpha/beta hydrolase-fold protein [Ruania alkalisoli]QOR71368.1 esterase family protein [Ruania alkalisoli]